MTPRRRRWLSACLGLGLVIVLLLVVSLDDQYVAEPPEAIVVREVQLYEPPPPPPAPPIAEPESSALGPQLAMMNLVNPIQLEIMELDVDLPSGQFGDFGSGFAGVGDGLGTGAGLDVVDFNELDSVPLPVQAPALVYPEEAIERGITEFQVFVHLLVDEEGRSFPIGIVQNPIPSFSQDVLDYTAQVRFTTPTRLGIPVKTEYLWPLLFRQPPTE